MAIHWPSGNCKANAERSKIHHDLWSLGETCAANTVTKFMWSARLRAQVGYKRCLGKYREKPAIVAANRLQQDFNIDAPDTVWVTDITYVRAHEGRLYLAAVIDLYTRKVVGPLSVIATQSSAGQRDRGIHAYSHLKSRFIAYKS